jgi:gamma-glutamylcyclotransferase (GGCT)/AIG2-like uncharacterized protein YtfP
MEDVFVFKTLEKRKTDTRALKHPLNGYEIVRQGTLPDYKDVNKGTGYHTIIKDKSSDVKGKILHITKKDLKKLDDWEDKYRRIKVVLKDGTKAWAYQLKVHKIIEAFLKNCNF